MTTFPQHEPTTETLSGRHTFTGTFCQYADRIGPDDIVVGNFDVKSVHTGGGLYLVEEQEAGQVIWRGCRRMTKTPAGVSIDTDGYGNWITVGSLEQCNWRVVGLVEGVYREL